MERKESPPLMLDGQSPCNKADLFKTIGDSTSVLGLDRLIQTRRERGEFTTNVVHMEVPFGKPIEEVYSGVHDGPLLGSGASGLVRKVTHRATGLEYAVKCLDIQSGADPIVLQQLREEIYSMSRLDHPNIVRLEEVYESHTEIYLVQELCGGETLFERLVKQKAIPEKECIRLVEEMLSAVRYLHSKGIIHRDLKLENFVFSTNSDDSEVKMIDFGLSKHFENGELHHDAVGTPYTVAPEVIRGSYDERCDVWAIGVMAYLLLSGEPPFGGCRNGDSARTIARNIMHGAVCFRPTKKWMNISWTAREFISSLLVKDPNSRPTATEAQNHKWIKRHRNSLVGIDEEAILDPNVVKGLVAFDKYSVLKKMMCQLMSFTLTPDQIRELRFEFRKMDPTGSGVISLSDFKRVLLNGDSELSEEQIENMFNAAHVHKPDMSIHWHEFIAASMSKCCKPDSRNLRLAFDRLDSEHKGYITVDDILYMLGDEASRYQGSIGTCCKDANLEANRMTYDDFIPLMKSWSYSEQQCK